MKHAKFLVNRKVCVCIYILKDKSIYLYICVVINFLYMCIIVLCCYALMLRESGGESSSLVSHAEEAESGVSQVSEIGTICHSPAQLW